MVAILDAILNCSYSSLLERLSMNLKLLQGYKESNHV